MIRTPTVFVLGAGASHPYGFPIGQQLVDQICNNPDQLRQIGFGGEETVRFVNELRDSHQPSIDAFLEIRQEFMRIGKTAIAYHLIGFESMEELRNQTGGRWYRHILNRMAGTKLEHFTDNNVSFVTFNYDRSLEQFFFTALRSRFNAPEDAVADVLTAVPIIHVHGQLGLLPWQNRDSCREYRAEQTKIDLARDGIKIVSESADNDPAFQAARKELSKAKRIGFLGFGYHQQNMDRLQVPLAKKDIFVGGTYTPSSDAQRTHIQTTRFPGLNVASAHVLEYLTNTLEFQPD